MFTTAVLLLTTFAPQQVSRADLAEAYLEFERAWNECRPEDPREQLRFHREVDTVAGAFFAGRYDRVVGLFGRLNDELRGRWPREAADDALRRLSAEARPAAAIGPRMSRSRSISELFVTMLTGWRHSARSSRIERVTPSRASTARIAGSSSS